MKAIINYPTRHITFEENISGDESKRWMLLRPNYMYEYYLLISFLFSERYTLLLSTTSHLIRVQSCILIQILPAILCHLYIILLVK
mgnify:CR=1 FL=1